MHVKPAARFVGPMQNENMGPLVQKVLRISRQKQHNRVLNSVWSPVQLHRSHMHEAGPVAKPSSFSQTNEQGWDLKILAINVVQG